MTDAEIIKALKICTNGKLGNEECINCPYKDKEDTRPCFDYLCLDALDLINRKNAEIERLKKENDVQLDIIVHHDDLTLMQTRFAVKEFAKEIINDILPLYLRGNEEIGIRLGFAISDKAEKW